MSQNRTISSSYSSSSSSSKGYAFCFYPAATKWRDDNNQTRAHSIEDEDDDEYENDYKCVATASSKLLDSLCDPF
jgi:hypothetical protein